MKNLFDQFERMFGVRIDTVFPVIVCAIGVFMFISLRGQVADLQREIGDIQHAQNSISTLSRSDLMPITTGLGQANAQLKQLNAQSAVLAEKIPAIENDLDLANQKLTFLQNPKAGTPQAPGNPH